MSASESQSPDPLLIHVGYHKTATTWLQDHVIPSISGLQLLSNGEMWDEFRALKNDVDHDTDRLRTLVERRWDGGPAMISYEGISGEPFATDSLTTRNAERVARLAPSAHILIVVRSQPGHIRSLYSQFVQEGGVATFDEWLDSTAFAADHLCFDVAVDAYGDLFGPANVTVLPYERLLTDPHGFLADAFASFGSAIELPGELPETRARTSPSAIGAETLRRVNRVARESSHHRRPSIARVAPQRVVNASSVFVRTRVRPRLLTMQGPKRLDRKLKDHQTARSVEFSERYRESNRRLAALVDWNPEDYGYPT